MTKHPFLATGSAFAAAAIFGLAGIAMLGGLGLTTGPSQAAGAAAVVGPGLILPPMDPVRGKALFASKGCVVCHAINGVGGTDAPDIGATAMAPNMNPFDFVAKMWNHSQGMVAMQMEELGGQIEFDNGQQLADIIAFLHDADVQKTFSMDDVPPEFQERLAGDGMGTMMKDGTMTKSN